MVIVAASFLTSRSAGFLASNLSSRQTNLILTRSSSSASALLLFGLPQRVLSSQRTITDTKTCTTKNMSTTTANNEEVKSSSEKSLEEISPSYKSLLEKLQTLTHLNRVSAVLNYDRMVFMPQSNENTSKSRGAQFSALASILHEKATDPSIGELLEASQSDLQSLLKESTEEFKWNDEKRILELAKKSYDRKVLIPASLEARRAALSSSANFAWVKARKEKDFSIFAESLEECFETAKELATVTQSNVEEKKSLYTQMLDEFEMGMDASRIDDIFGKIESALKPLIAQVIASDEKPSTSPLEGSFDISKQKELGEKIVTSMGFDLESGRIDESVHPFTSSFGPSDVRITSRFKETEWYQGLAANIHEAGHAMYEQNVGPSDLEIDSYLSMGMHESQSLFWERHVGKLSWSSVPFHLIFGDYKLCGLICNKYFNCIGLSEEFCTFLTPLLKESFGESYDFTPNDVYGAINAVSASFIRVEADELTYPLHVILRYNIERDVVEGKMDVKDIPKRWNDEMKTTFDLDVPDDSMGCLQDVHWSALAIGYFPTYLLGSATAAQLAHYCEKDIPDMYKKIENGEFSEIKKWLTDKVHRHGKRYESLDALLTDQVGEPLNPQYFIDYLTKKYKALYNL